MSNLGIMITWSAAKYAKKSKYSFKHRYLTHNFEVTVVAKTKILSVSAKNSRLNYKYFNTYDLCNIILNI